MRKPIAFEDAIDLLDMDHKMVKQMFIDYATLCAAKASSGEKRDLSQRICQALTNHAQLEEEIFYPQVRAAIGNDALMDEALDEHAEAKALISQIEDKARANADVDASVRQLGTLIDLHVLEEREQIFLQARYAALDLRGMVLPLLKRQQQLKKAAAAEAGVAA